MGLPYINLALPYMRTYSGHIDLTGVFTSLEDARKYAAADPDDPDSRGYYAVSYIGQILAVYENNDCKLYYIKADRTLGEVGEGGGGSYVLPPATRSTLGGIKVGRHLYVEADGTLNSTDTTYEIFSAGMPGLVPAAGSDQTLFLKSNGQWAAPTFSIPIADASNLGGIKVGTTLTIDETGVLNWNGINYYTKSETEGAITLGVGIAEQYTDDELAAYEAPAATSTTRGGILSQTTGTTANRDYVIEVDASGKAKVNVPWVDTDTTYNVFNTTTDGLAPKANQEGDTQKFLRGDGTWQAPTFAIPIAGPTTIGGILSQTTGTTASRDYVVEVDSEGHAKVNVPWTDTVYSLPTASSSTLGGIKIGNNLTINATGVVSATDTTYQVFGRSLNGLVPGTTAGDNTKFLKGDGTWDIPQAVIPDASYTQKGVIKVGRNLIIESDGTLNALDTQYHTFRSNYDGLVPHPNADTGETEKYLKGDGTWQAPSFALEPASANILGGIKIGQNLAWNELSGRVDATDTTYTLATTAASGLMPSLLETHGNKFLRADGTWQEVDVATKQDLVEQIVLL